MYDAQYHRSEANRFFLEYKTVQDKIDKMEADALKAASGWEKAQSLLLGNPTSDAAFKYTSLCKNRNTFITLINMHSNMALMLTEVKAEDRIPEQRGATSKTRN